jgi:hypothetical protein
MKRFPSIGKLSKRARLGIDGDSGWRVSCGGGVPIWSSICRLAALRFDDGCVVPAGDWTRHGPRGHWFYTM